MKTHYWRLIPLGLLALFAASGLAERLLTDHVFDTQSIVGQGSVALALGIAALRTDKKAAFYASGIIAFLGAFVFLTFTPTVSTYSIGIFGLSATFQLIPLLIFGVWFFIFLKLDKTYWEQLLRFLLA